MVALVIHVSTVAVVFTVVFTEARSPILIGMVGFCCVLDHSCSNRIQKAIFGKVYG